MTTATVTPQQLETLHCQGTPIELIDVRTPAEFREVHVPFARNVPLDRLNSAEFQQRDPSQPLYVICRSGSRARQACEKLTAAGLPCAVNVEGGTLAWEQAGLPVVRGQKAMSLERQVRIAAGLLVIVGSALGYFVDPAWFGLSAFVGAGLVFAGITDSCPMAMMFARMPWNQVSGPSSCISQTESHDSASGATCCSLNSGSGCCR